LFLLFLVYSAVPGSQAKKLEKQMLQVTSREYFEISHRVLNGKSALNDIDKKGFTPLHNAAIKNQKDVVELLLANQAMVNARAKDGGTPLHYASFLGNLEIAELLLANHSDVNAKNNDGETPLHLATEEGRQEMAELLRLHGGQE
jgi:cytohesin